MNVSATYGPNYASRIIPLVALLNLKDVPALPIVALIPEALEYGGFCPSDSLPGDSPPFGMMRIEMEVICRSRNAQDHQYQQGIHDPRNDHCLSITYLKVVDLQQ